MKILYVDPVRLPTEKAHGIQIMEMCAAFKRQGIDVELIASARKTPIIEEPFHYYDIRERFSIRRLHAPDLTNFGPIGYWIFLVIFSLRAIHYARHARADIVYVRTPVVAKLFSRWYPGPVVWEVHTRHVIPRKVLRGLSLVVPITHGLAQWLRVQGAPSDRIHVAPDGVNTAKFEVSDRETVRKALREKLGLQRNAQIALYLGSFGVYSWKGVDIARAAAEKSPTVTWLFVGGSLQECDDLMRAAPPNVRTLPRAKRAEIAELLCAADILLLPNKRGDIASEQDTSPLKLFEYMASGVPIIASDLPSIREILTPQTAFFIPPNDPDALAAAVNQVIGDVIDRTARAQAARNEVGSFTWDVRAKGIVAAIIATS